MPGNILTVGGITLAEMDPFPLQKQVALPENRSSAIKGNASGRTRVAVTQAGGTWCRDTLMGLK